MVALSSKFVALAASCALAVLPGSVAEARAITSRGHEASMLTSSTSGIIAGRNQKAETVPILSLPDSLSSDTSTKPSLQSKTGDETGKKKSAKKRVIYEVTTADNTVNDNTWDPLDPLFSIGSFEIGDGRDSDYSSTHHILKRSSRIFGRHPHHHDDRHDGEVVVDGTNDFIQVDRDLHGSHDRERSFARPFGRRHYHSDQYHDGHHHERAIDASADDTWDPLDPLFQIGDFEIGDGRNSIYSSTHHILARASGSRHHQHAVIVKGQGGHVRVSERRDLGASIAGVPGTIDIVTFGSASPGERLASLVLTAVNATSQSTAANSSISNNSSVSSSSNQSSSPFILDASNSTQSQVYLVPMVSNNSTNSTMSANSTDTNSTMSSSFGPMDLRVTLQVPVFDAVEASLDAYCATFDPDPPAPAPLSMERCFDDQSTNNDTLHKSQSFVYNSDSGIIRPLWLAPNSVQQADVEPSANGSSSASVGTNTTMSVMSNSTATNSTTNANAPASPESVALVFTPADPVLSVQSPTTVEAFAPGSQSSNPDNSSMDGSMNANITNATTSAVVSSSMGSPLILATFSTLPMSSGASSSVSTSSGSGPTPLASPSPTTFAEEVQTVTSTSTIVENTAFANGNSAMPQVSASSQVPLVFSSTSTGSSSMLSPTPDASYFEWMFENPARM